MVHAAFDAVTAELVYNALRAHLKSLVIRWRPPVVKPAYLIELRALIVKAMRDFMTDHGPDGAIVHGVVCFHIKQRGHENSCGKDNFVQERVVVSIRSWRR